MTLDQFIIFLPAAILLGASPGANNLLAFTSAARSGWRGAAKGILGRLAAWAILVALVSLGLDVLLRTSELAFFALKWIGVAYLLYVAYSFWTAPTSARDAPPPPRILMRREFLTLMGNPKAYLLLTAFLPQFVSTGAPVLPQLALLGALYILVEGLAALLWVGLGHLAGEHAMTPIRRRWLNRGSAGVMGAAAILLARSERAA